MSSRTELAALPATFDLVIVGGGITGAGVLREAVRTGARVLLVEQGDFASGTSSWSSKLVHGGLRYLKSGQWRLTLESVRERQRLLREAEGLIEPQPFLMPLYQGIRPGRAVMRIGLFLYDLMAGEFKSKALSREAALALEPGLRREGLVGAVCYEDARTDDARLTLRLIFESVTHGATALNYVQAQLSTPGQVQLVDQISGQQRAITAGMVIYATGAWAGSAPQAPPLRPLRGSHFIFPAARLPITRAVSWLHPVDRRPIFAYPWEGAVVYGTTDLDHAQSLEWPRMTAAESDYLISGLQHQFPALGLTARDALSTYSGVRPVVAGGKADPSAESRESAMWSAPGLVCLAGGKLTTFRIAGRKLLEEAARQVPALTPRDQGPVFALGARPDRLAGRLGAAAAQVRQFDAAEQARIGESLYTWAELRWSLRHEQVIHLDDLLLRRTRLGLVLPEGALPAVESRLPAMCQQELGWDDHRWQEERARYQALWRRQHAPETA